MALKRYKHYNNQKMCVKEYIYQLSEMEIWEVLAQETEIQFEKLTCVPNDNEISQLINEAMKNPKYRQFIDHQRIPQDLVQIFKQESGSILKLYEKLENADFFCQFGIVYQQQPPSIQQVQVPEEYCQKDDLEFWQKDQIKPYETQEKDSTISKTLNQKNDWHLWPASFSNYNQLAQLEVWSCDLQKGETIFEISSTSSKHNDLFKSVTDKNKTNNFDEW